jgi:NADP-dependent 3-hydroxy acid dehydrogenase YdfG
MMPLDGRTALVSGASRGIGLAIARALVAAGARVGMLARGEQELSARASELGERATAFRCDVGDAAAVARVVADASRAFGGAPDVVVNNAGLFELARIEEMRVEDFARILDVNLVGSFALVRAVLSPMRVRGSGHLVTIGSIADRVTFPENGAYAASKFGMRALHQVLREELRGTGVRATLISPGPVDTPLWDAVEPDTKPGFTPRRAMLAPDAVAAAVAYAVTQPATTNVDELRLSRS